MQFSLFLLPKHLTGISGCVIFNHQLKGGIETMEQFEKMIEELMVHYPTLLSANWFRELEIKVREEITRWEEIMNQAGIV